MLPAVDVLAGSAVVRRVIQKCVVSVCAYVCVYIDVYVSGVVLPLLRLHRPVRELPSACLGAPKQARLEALQKACLGAPKRAWGLPLALA